jgi:hypothetical protein
MSLTSLGLFVSAGEKYGVNIDLFGPNTRFFRTLSDAYFMLQATWAVFAWMLRLGSANVVCRWLLGDRWVAAGLGLHGLKDGASSLGGLFGA